MPCCSRQGAAPYQDYRHFREGALGSSPGGFYIC